MHWRAGADWLVAHLLDGDLARNHLSWQWLAGAARVRSVNDPHLTRWLQRVARLDAAPSLFPSG